VKFARCTSPACTSATISTVDSSADVGQYTSITIGADANPIIAYYDSANGDVKVVSLVQTAWVPNSWGR
jgi:hypothetical protein